ncbi:hypothetical protein [Streptomyces sp. NBC_01190]|uniref:hypothetical protein n=1 Tax=Streptomyces sp. NBC_01190 TaxID=2903767 RepID=UPI00386D349C|nr:hypothetical protein OG519_28775 [Streptomyces sp. NBC_01190]
MGSIQATVTFQREGAGVTAQVRGDDPQRGFADSALHYAGFVPVARLREHYHRLPLGMTRPDEQRQTVTRAIDLLQADGIDFSADPDLIDTTLLFDVDTDMSLGDRLAQLTDSLSRAHHTTEAVAALSELTAPGTGALQRVVEALEATADWWEGLGGPADPLYAARLRRIAGHVDICALEIRSLRGELADRHTDHPDRVRVHTDRVASDDPTASRVTAALAVSPTARRDTPAAIPPTPAERPALPAGRPPATPGR